jgi:uncharacterized protein
MLTFDLRSIEANALTVDDQLSADDPVWQEDDPKPDTAVRVTGRISVAGSGQFYWHGHISGAVTVECRRCLSEAHGEVDGETHVIFAESTDETVDDPDVYLIDTGALQIDLRPAIREEWLLAQPRFLECRQDCKGLCPKCGQNLNEGPCDCPPQTDSRWDSLRKVEKA